MKLSAVAQLYAVRLKTRAALGQEALALLGIAVGVALLFASQVASSSLNGSVRQLTSGIIGHSQYQLKARDLEGFDASLLGQVAHLPGVSATVPVLEHPVSLIGASGRKVAVDLLATDPRDLHLAGPLLRHFTPQQLAGQHALALPEAVAHAIGAGPLEPIKVQVGAHVVPSLVATSLSPAELGALANSPVAVTPLAYAQQLTGLPGRLTRIFVTAKPGDSGEVRAGLTRLAAGHLNVEPADFDATLFAQAAAPVNQSTETFAAICALVGFVFAFSSMLLTTPTRQRLIRELRRTGATRPETVRALLFDALVLGGLGALLGLALGDLLSIGVFGSNPGYLAFAFPIAAQRVVTWQSVVLAVGAGLLAAAVGVLAPLRDVWAHAKDDDAGYQRSILERGRVAMLSAGLLCLLATTIIVLAAPGSAIVAIVTLTVGLALLLPLLIDAILAVFDRVQRRVGAPASEIAVIELRSPKTRLRSIAIAATGAIAVFGSVTIQGSRTNLEDGIDRLTHQLSAVADLWVLPADANDLLVTTPFPNASGPALTRLAGVRAVGLYRSAFLEDGDRRVWVLAPPPTASQPLPSGQLIAGNRALATTRLRAGGWAVVSQTLAAERRLHIGQYFTLPSPRPTSLRVAALSTNFGWPPGAIVLNSADFARAWNSTDLSAYNVMLAPGASAPQVAREIKRTLGPTSSLTVQTARERERSQVDASYKGLVRLRQIALLVSITGALAMAISMGAVVWQRRQRFARIRIQGLPRGVLWLALIWESVLLLGSGCLIGAVFGVYGQLLLSRALLTSTGFPVLFSARIPLAAESFLIVAAVAIATVAILGYRATGVRPHSQP
ncbi:MAG TPA: ABC transporter permease [Solirubrobacteraceae bacterium]|jgi:putative ABC transport system permease protein